MSRTEPHPIVWPAILLIMLLLPACAQQLPEEIAVGTLERDRLELVAETSEPIVELRVAEGEQVAAGEVLVRLDPARAEATYKVATAGVEIARAALKERLRGTRVELIEEARARLRGAQSELDDAERELERQLALEVDGVGAKAPVDRVRARRDRARAQLEELETALERNIAGATREEIDLARSSLTQAEAELELLELDIERLSIRATRSGRVEALPYELGERPPAGATVAVLLLDAAPYARVHVPQGLRANLQIGDRAVILVEGIDRRFAGSLRQIAAEADFTPFYALTEKDRGRLSYLAEIELEDAESLATGLPVEVSFESEIRSEPNGG